MGEEGIWENWVCFRTYFVCWVLLCPPQEDHQRRWSFCLVPIKARIPTAMVVVGILRLSPGYFSNPAFFRTNIRLCICPLGITYRFAPIVRMFPSASAPALRSLSASFCSESEIRWVAICVVMMKASPKQSYLRLELLYHIFHFMSINFVIKCWSRGFKLK